MTPLAPLRPEEMQLGSDPDILRQELLMTIRRGITDHPRSSQLMIGPSELGTPCDRKLAFRLAETLEGESDTQPRPSWRPTVGTAVHAWLAGVMDADNERARQSGIPERWAVERRVMVGTVGGQEVWGSCDLYDRVTGTVIDWKIVGTQTLRQAKRWGPSKVYRAQAHLYGRGFRHIGLPVERVSLCYLPSAGELRDMVWWIRPYEETVATQALSRADGLMTALRHAGRQLIIPSTPTTEGPCEWCPWWAPGQESIDPTRRCAGPALKQQEWRLDD